MFRVAVAHSDTDHPNATAFTYHEAKDRREDAEAMLDEARAEYPVKDGYTHTVEELVVTGSKGAWKDTSQKADDKEKDA